MSTTKNKGLIYLLVIIILALLAFVGLLLRKYSDCEKNNPSKPVVKKTTKTVKILFNGKAKNLAFTIWNKDILIIKSKTDTNLLFTRSDSFHLESGVALRFSRKMDSIIVADPVIPPNYLIFGICTSFLPMLPNGVNNNGNEVVLSGPNNAQMRGNDGQPNTDANTNVPGQAIILNNNNDTLYFRVRGMSNGFGNGVTGQPLPNAYFSIDIPIGYQSSSMLNPVATGDLYLMLDQNYSSLLLIGYPPTQPTPIWNVVPR